MHISKKIKFFVLICAVSLSLSSCARLTDAAINREDSDSFLFLFAGFDDAAENTDVIFTLGYDKSERRVTVAQIPRDTYFEFGDGQNKINQYYATMRSQGVGREAAMKKTAETIELLFGTQFDGFLGVTTDAFRDVVDSIGGIDIELSHDIEISLDTDESPIILKAGNNHIDGALAERFVRYRRGYAMGDLGRIDAQKMFLNALFKKVASGVTLPTLISIANTLQQKAVTDISLVDAVRLLLGNLGQGGGGTTLFATVPGEAIQNENGLSYYVLNRKCAAELAKRYMFATEEFDPDYRLAKDDNAGFMNIYEDENFVLREYSADSIKDMRINKNY